MPPDASTLKRSARAGGRDVSRTQVRPSRQPTHATGADVTSAATCLFAVATAIPAPATATFPAKNGRAAFKRFLDVDRSAILDCSSGARLMSVQLVAAQSAALASRCARQVAADRDTHAGRHCARSCHEKRGRGGQ
jgi:hypothetical protein